MTSEPRLRKCRRGDNSGSEHGVNPSPPFRAERLGEVGGDTASYGGLEVWSGAPPHLTSPPLGVEAVIQSSVSLSPIIAVAGLRDAVEVELPDAQVDLAGFDRGVLHAVLRRELCHRLPAHIRMLDIGLLVELEEIQLRVAEVEELGPALALEAEPAALPEFAMAVSGNVDALGAGVGDDALDPVPVAHQTLPGGPGDLGRGQRL